jgi:uncharacterized membrane protein
MGPEMAAALSVIVRDDEPSSLSRGNVDLLLPTSRIQRASFGPRERWRGWPLAFVAIASSALLAFVCAPWPIEGKSLAVLHGLCAQQATHSFYFGAQRLPFDARMTGIYGGFAITALFLLSRGRWRAGGVPSTGVLFALGLSVAALASDGINSTLADAGIAHVYAPRNEARLVTGLLTGTSLAVFIWLLLGQIGFASCAARRVRVITGRRELAALLGIQALFALLVYSTWWPLRVPLTLLLLASAVSVLTGLVLAFVLLLSRRENQALDTWQLAGPATAALLIAFALLGLTGGGRFLFEALLHLPPTGST